MHRVDDEFNRPGILLPRLCDFLFYTVYLFTAIIAPCDRLTVSLPVFYPFLSIRVIDKYAYKS
jgi:hypothetical protein